jgi:hypothetical protein
MKLMVRSKPRVKMVVRMVIKLSLDQEANQKQRIGNVPVLVSGPDLDLENVLKDLDREDEVEAESGGGEVDQGLKIGSDQGLEITRKRVKKNEEVETETGIGTRRRK